MKQKTINTLDRARLMCLLGENGLTATGYQPASDTVYFSLPKAQMWQVSVSKSEVFISALSDDMLGNDRIAYQVAGFCALANIQFDTD